MTKRDELVEQLDAKSAQLHAIFQEMGPDRDMSKVTSIEGDSTAKAQQIQKRNDELATITKQLEELDAWDASENSVKGIRDGLSRPANRVPFAKNGQEQGEPRVKAFREILEASPSYKAFQQRGGGTAVIELNEVEAKTLMTLTTINNPTTRAPGIQTSAQEERTVRDLMLQGTTDNNAMSYMVETTFTNSSATVAEGGTKPESALGFTERTDNVRKIATWLPATSELLADVSGIESYIRERLSFMARRTEEAQLLLGDGIAPNILGVELRSGVQTQAKGADPVPDAIYKGMNLVRNTGFAEPTAVVFHPNDWMDIRLLRTADGIYIWGSPSDAGPERIWGLPIRVTTAQTQNTALVGAFRPMAQVFQREGITITISTEHSTYFVENKVAILAEERLALAVYRPSAFATVTGI